MITPLVEKPGGEPGEAERDRRRAFLADWIAEGQRRPAPPPPPWKRLLAALH